MKNQIEPILTRPMHGGFQKVYRFPNGYGASVIRHAYSYGLELAVVMFDDAGDWGLAYNTYITDDVIGHLDEDGVSKLLEEIQSL